MPSQTPLNRYLSVWTPNNVSPAIPIRVAGLAFCRNIGLLCR